MIEKFLIVGLLLIASVAVCGQVNENHDAKISLLKSLQKFSVVNKIRLYCLPSTVRDTILEKSNDYFEIEEGIEHFSRVHDLHFYQASLGVYLVSGDQELLIEKIDSLAQLGFSEETIKWLGFKTIKRIASSSVRPVQSFLIKGEPLYRAFDKLSEKFETKIYYDLDDIPYFSKYIQTSAVTLYEYLNSALKGSPLKVVKYSADTYVVVPLGNNNREYADKIVAKWESGRFKSLDKQFNKERKIVLDGGGISKSGIAVKGQVLDAETSEPIIGAALYNPTLKQGTTTDIDGKFEFLLDPGQYVLEISMLGYAMQYLELAVISEDSPIEIQLPQLAIGIEEVVVSSKSLSQRVSDASGELRFLKREDLRLLPVLTGELDVLQALSQTAGVTATSEAAAGISVRGGALDQNIVRASGIDMLYPVHSLGFYPLFIPEMIDEVTLHRGYVPSNFGGRAASIIDVKWKKADLKEWNASVGLNPAVSKVTLDGPVLKNKVGFLGGGRFSHVGYLLKSQRNGNIRRSSVRFADFNSKITGKWSSGSVELSSIYTRDYFRYLRQFDFDYSNFGVSAELRQSLSLKNFLRARISRSAYRNELNNFTNFRGTSSFRSGLDFYSTSLEIRRDHSENLVFNVGVGVDVYNSLGREQFVTTALFNRRPFSHSDPGLQRLFGFVGSEYRVSEYLSMNLDARIVNASTVYKNTGFRNLYKDIPALGGEERVSTSEAGDLERLPIFVQPRIRLSFAQPNRMAYGLSYSRLVQDIHQLSPTVSPSPADVFFVSTSSVPSTVSDVVSISIGKSELTGSKKLSFELSGFYRRVLNQNLARDGFLLRNTDVPEQGVYTADGYSAGTELTLRKPGYKHQFTLNYAYIRSYVNVDDRYPEMSFLKTSKISSSTDIPHQLNINYSYFSSSRFSLSASWTLSSGRPFTSTDGLLFQQGVFIPTFGKKFDDRLPPTHRLDLNFDLDNTKSKTDGLVWGFNLSVFNLYQRENPFGAFYSFRDVQRLQAFQFSVLGSAIPMFTLNVKWK